MYFLKTFFKALIRRKPLETDTGVKSRLVRCLNTFDLTALGVGSTLGLGIYVLAGHVAYKLAGPSVVLSFIIAAVASVFAGLCYAEFGARVPRAGSAYVYSYVTVGEFMAFVIGWNLILEYVIGAASVARGFSGYVDSLIDNKIASYFNATFPLNIPGASPYFDWFAFSLTLLLAVLLAFGVKESTSFTAVFTTVNLYAVFFVIIAGSFRASFSNWFIPESEVPAGFGVGGFFPFGFQGVMRGAATCFYGFVGFDAIASTGEEAKDPHKSIPISITISLFLILLTYLGVAGVSTLMAPYWVQGSNAPLTDLFEMNGGWIGSKYIITIGAITSLSTALLGSIFPLPRVLFAMSADGLLPPIFKSTLGPNRSPVFATLFSGIFAGLMAALFDTDQLTDMMSIGTLLAYTLVALSVLILRYRDDPQTSVACDSSELETDTISQNSLSTELITEEKSHQHLLSLLWNTEGYDRPNSLTSTVSATLIGIISLLCLILDACLVYLYDELIVGSPVACSLVVGIFSLILFFTYLLNRQPQSTIKLSFKVPFLPSLPIISAIFNFYLMYNLSRATWYRFIFWMAVGLSTYFLYSIRNSKGYLASNDRTKDVDSNKNDVGQVEAPPINGAQDRQIDSNKLNNL